MGPTDRLFQIVRLVPARAAVAAVALATFVGAPAALAVAAAESARTPAPPVVAVAIAAAVDSIQGSAEARQYKVQAGDLITLSVEEEPDLAVEAVIGDDGMLAVPELDEPEQATGRSVDELRAVIELKLRKRVPNAVVSLVLRQPGGRRIYAVGKLDRKGGVGNGLVSVGSTLNIDTANAAEEGQASSPMLALDVADSPFDTPSTSARVAALALSNGHEAELDRNGTVLMSATRSFQDITVVRRSSFQVTNFLAPSAGQVTVAVTDIRWRSLLAQLATSVTSGGRTIGSLNGSGNLIFSVQAGQRFAVAIFAAAASSASNLGLYKLGVSFQPLATSPVPLPATGWLLLSGLAALGARGRLLQVRGRKSTVT